MCPKQMGCVALNLLARVGPGSNSDGVWIAQASSLVSIDHADNHIRLYPIYCMHVNIFGN